MLLQAHLVVVLIKLPAEVPWFAIVLSFTMGSNVSHWETKSFERPDSGGSTSETVVALYMARARLTFHPASALFCLRITNSGIALVRIDALSAIVHVTILSLLKAARLLREFVENLTVRSSIRQFVPRCSFPYKGGENGREQLRRATVS